MVRTYFFSYFTKSGKKSVADPGFPVGGVCRVIGGCQPLMWVLFGKNVCENERIGSCWEGARAGGAPPQIHQ